MILSFMYATNIGQKKWHVTKSNLILAISVAWLTITGISGLPLIGLSYFSNKNFIKSGSCLLFNFGIGKYEGWEYVTISSLVLNTVMIASVVGFCSQVMEMVIANDKHLRKFGNTTGRRSVYQTVNLLIILVASNLLCLLPMLILLLLTIFDFTIPEDIVNWFIILILPLNSQTNPFIYTIRNIFKRKQQTHSASDITGKTDIFHLSTIISRSVNTNML